MKSYDLLNFILQSVMIYEILGIVMVVVYGMSFEITFPFKHGKLFYLVQVFLGNCM